MTLTAAVLGAGLAAPTSAWAGGIGTIGSPAFDNTCVTGYHLTEAMGRTVNSPGVAANLLQLPLDARRQQCGGADLPGADVPFMGGANDPFKSVADMENSAVGKLLPGG